MNEILEKNIYRCKGETGLYPHVTYCQFCYSCKRYGQYLSDFSNQEVDPEWTKDWVCETDTDALLPYEDIVNE